MSNVTLQNTTWGLNAYTPILRKTYDWFWPERRKTQWSLKISQNGSFQASGRFFRTICNPWLAKLSSAKYQIHLSNCSNFTGWSKLNEVVPLFHSLMNTAISVVFFQRGCWQFTAAAKDCFTISEMPELSYCSGIHKIEGVFTHLHIIVYGFTEKREEKENRRPNPNRKHSCGGRGWWWFDWQLASLFSFKETLKKTNQNQMLWHYYLTLMSVWPEANPSCIIVLQ